MTKILYHWFVGTLVILIAAYIVPGTTVTLIGAVIAAVVLGALNLFIRPIIRVIALPITILTLGLFSLVIDALLVLLTSSLGVGFFVAGFWPAFFFALVLTVINWVFHFWSR
ncbi:MAG: phage holin family protein [bacterium]|nr:phage holin family protein [bacterium]